MPMKKRTEDAPCLPPFWVLATGILAISTGAIFARMAHTAHPFVIAAYRVGLAALILLSLLILFLSGLPFIAYIYLSLL